MTQFFAGAATRDTTPSAAMLAAGSIWLWGYGSRTAPCTVVDQPLSTRAAVLGDQQGGFVALVSIDIGALDPALTARVKSRISATHPSLPPQAICLNVSHTHSAPVGMSIPTFQLGCGVADPGYQAFLEDQIVGVITDAFAACRPASIAWARGSAPIGYDRHPLADGPHYDPTLDVVQVTGDGGGSIATLFSTACHPTAHADIGGISSDFPGFARDQIQARFGGVGIFLQSYAGTCVPLETTDDATVGASLANAVIATLQAGSAPLNGPIGAWLTEIFLPFQYFDPATLPHWQQWAQTPGIDPLAGRWVALMQAQGRNIPASLPTPLQAIRIGTPPCECHIVASGHEVAMNFLPTIRDIWPGDRITLLGYSNAQHDYLTTASVIEYADDRAIFPDFTQMTNYEAGTAPMWYGHRGPLTTEVDAVFTQGHATLAQYSQQETAVIIYAVVQDGLKGEGNLLWYKHLGYANGADQWLTTPDAKGHIGEGWNPSNLQKLFGGGNGVIYAVDRNGFLLWYRHLGFQTGADLWLTTPDPKGHIGEGWGQDNIENAFSGGGGVLYAVNAAGNLLWFKHLGYNDGTDSWLTTPDPKGHIGEGWGENNFVEVFSGGGGVIYAINKAGNLLWYKHLGFADGTDRWLTTPDPKGYIGEGWGRNNFLNVFSGGDGIIYATTLGGNLIWYKHLGYADGTDRWQTSKDPKGYIGEGWLPGNFSRLICNGFYTP